MSSCIECSICMEVITEINKTTTECGHIFHSYCIFKNLCERNGCPMCRKELVEVKETDSDSDYETESDYDSEYSEIDDTDENTEYSSIKKEIIKYVEPRDSDPVISHQQVADKMLQLGV